MKALVGAFNQEKAQVGAFSVIVQPVVEPMDQFAALNNLYSPGTAHCRNGYIDGQDKKTNLRNIFDDSIIARILDYYGEVKILIII